MTGPQPVSATENYSASTFANVPVAYQVNGSAPVQNHRVVTLPGLYRRPYRRRKVPADQYRLPFDFWVHENTDNYALNDSLLLLWTVKPGDQLPALQSLWIG